MADSKYDAITVYGPFHRLANELTQRPQGMRAILLSGELWGGPARFSTIPAVKAYFGTLPGGEYGFEFYALTPPDRPFGGVVYWRERADGTVWVVDEQARVNIVVKRVDQEL